MMTYNEMIAVIQAHKEGKVIQFKDGLQWLNVPTPQFDFAHREYRIKPEPRKPRRVWVKFDSHGNILSCIFHPNIDSAIEFVESIKDFK